MSVGTARSGFGDLASALLFAWAYLEITDGADLFRRLLGVVVLVVVVAGFFVR